MIPLIVSVTSFCPCVCFFLFFRRYIEKKTAARELLADYRTETYRLIAEIDAAADRDSLLVEERIKTLKQLLDDTDRRIAVYMRELQRSRAGEALYTSLGRGIRAALDSRPLPEGSSPAETAPPQEAMETAVPPSPKEIPAPRESATGKRKPKKTKIKAQIAELSAKGLSPPEIASRLNLSLAEVDLALSLLNQ
jgi:DNA-binding NarL/FixJ family response regulator